QLRAGSELANGLDLVSEQLRSYRAPCRRGKDIHNATPHRELAPVLDDVDAHVAERRQLLQQLIERRRLPPADLEWLVGTQLRRNALQCCKNGGSNDHRSGRLPDAICGGGATPGGQGTRADALVRQGLPRRKQDRALPAQAGGGAVGKGLVGAVGGGSG